jgi:hypothetical protein
MCPGALSEHLNERALLPVAIYICGLIILSITDIFIKFTRLNCLMFFNQITRFLEILSVSQAHRLDGLSRSLRGTPTPVKC